MRLLFGKGPDVSYQTDLGTFSKRQPVTVERHKTWDLMRINWTAGLPQFGIHCALCGRTSWNKNDVEQKFCANCGIYHDSLKDLIADPAKAAEVLCVCLTSYGWGVNVNLAAGTLICSTCGRPADPAKVKDWKDGRFHR